MVDVEINGVRYVSRAANHQDVDQVVELINAAWLADLGTVGTNRDELLIEWGMPQLDLQTDTQVILTSGGQLVGYLVVWDAEPHVRIYLFGRVHPDYRGQGIGNHLVEWGEARALRSVGKAPERARISLHTSANHGDDPQRELFELRGFRLVRHFFRMLIEMEPETAPVAPIWPDGVQVRPFVRGQDERAAYHIIQDAFKDHWGFVQGETFEEWMHWIDGDKSFDPSVCYLAIADGAQGEEAVAVLMSRSEWEEDPSIAWVDELGVLRPWRRKGIALALLQHAFDQYHKRGKYKVGLGVDGQSLTGATRLYERAGMRVMRQFDAYEKVLRPGEDLSTQELET
jgi:mycothiol synthase